MEDCKQVNIPKTDNTEIPCEEYIKETCVIIEEAVPFIGSGAGIALKELIERVIDKMKNQQRQINNLRRQLTDLTN